MTVELAKLLIDRPKSSATNPKAKSRPATGQGGGGYGVGTFATAYLCRRHLQTIPASEARKELLRLASQLDRLFTLSSLLLATPTR